MAESENYILLILKLDEFIRKYYKNRILRGLIYFAALLIIFYLLAVITEYFARFGNTARAIVFYSWLTVNAFILSTLVIIPVFKLLKFGKIISHEQAAGIIGSHFPEVRDKLLNTLQLKELEGSHDFESEALIRASIDQKIGELKPIPFKAAIDLKKNSRYLKYAVPPLLILLLLMIASPGVVTEPTARIIQYGKVFSPELPFTLRIINEKLEAFQQEDFTLEVKVSGEELPAEVIIESNGVNLKMNRLDPLNFRYTFKNLQDDKSFYLVAGRLRSQEYELKVLPKPVVLNFDVSLDYPEYTGKTDEKIENTGDLVIPIGTVVTWKFYTRDTRSIFIHMGDQSKELISTSSNAFIFQDKIYKSIIYSIVSANEFVRSSDSINYSISVMPDAYPSVSVEHVQDSVLDKRIYFRGLIKDDYGFTRLTFNYIIFPEDKPDTASTPEIVAELPVSKVNNQQQFFHFFELDSIEIHPGDQVAYHFEVWDNDGVNGPKVSKSQTMFFKAPTKEEIEERTEKENQEIKDDIENSIKDVQELQKKIDELNRKLLEKESLGWQEKQQVQDLLNEQKELQQKIEEIQKENEIKSLQEQQYKQIDEELIRKQKQLEDLFNQVMTDEMKKKFEELQKLLENIDKEKLNETLQKMKMDNKEIEKQLDRNLELFKQLEFEKKLQEAIDKLNDLSKKQDDLSKETEQGKKDQDDLKNKQDELTKEFEKLRKDLDDLEKQNKELENPNSLENTDQKEEEIQKDMNQSSDELNQSKPGKASKSQKGAAQKMQDLSNQLMQMQNEMYEEDLGENIESLREILENLLQLSFDQEDLIAGTNSTSTLDPKYIKLIESQKRIKDDLVMVEDSLWALSKRQSIIEPVITKEIKEININVDDAIKNLTERKKPIAAENQQYAMTSINNLALLLSEALQQMMNAMQMQSSGQCHKGSPKPGKGTSSMKGMRQMQQQLNQQIQQLKEGLGKNQGQQRRSDNDPSSEQFARMAAQQEAIRRMMEQYQDQLKEQGLGGDKELQDIMKEMEKNETELVNKMVTQQMMERLKNIETRLLKHEKAELQREQEEKRESREAKDEIYSNPIDFLEYNNIKSREVELLRTVPPNLRPFYKSKVNEYFYNFEVK